MAASAGTLTAAWPDQGNEWCVAIWLVDGGNLTGTHRTLNLFENVRGTRCPSTRMAH
jgi:hypothetical protein